MGRRRRNSRRSKARSRARSRAKASAKKRNTARKKAGRKPSGAKTRSQARASARARAQASAKKRVAAKKAAGKKPSGAKSRSQAKADNRAKAQSMAKKRIAAKKAAPAKKTINKVSAKQFDSRKIPSAASSFNKQLKNIQAANVGPVRDGATYAKNLTNYNMKYGKTPAIRAKAYEQTLSGRKGLFDNATSGSGPVASGDAYARGLQTSRFGSPMNAAKTVLNTVPGVNFRLQNDKELADSVGRAPTLARRGGGGGKALAVQTDPIRTPPPEEIIEETQPITGDTSGTDAGNLTRIQNQAYSSTLSNNLAGLTGNFDFGPQSSQMAISQAPELQAGQSRGRKRVRRFGRGRGRGEGDSFRRGGRRIQQFTSSQLNI